MLSILKRLLDPAAGGQEAIHPRDAQIIDVRTAAEFRQGHCPGSRNIPVDELAGRLAELDPRKPILTCCASGMRSGIAKRILAKAGFTQVENGGTWADVKRRLG